MSRYDWGEPKIPRVNPEVRSASRSKPSQFRGEGTGPLGHEGWRRECDAITAGRSSGVTQSARVCGVSIQPVLDLQISLDGWILLGNLQENMVCIHVFTIIFKTSIFFYFFLIQLWGVDGNGPEWYIIWKNGWVMGLQYHPSSPFMDGGFRSRSASQLRAKRSKKCKLREGQGKSLLRHITDVYVYYGLLWIYSLLMFIVSLYFVYHYIYIHNYIYIIT